ncbi:MAG TPA: response regulator transcription factor [Saprospiraceae bacterium]|nr:response regulator transcription factor [Saprospiraceae bacterium]
MCIHHVLVATSPLYLLGLEAVITQNVTDPVISLCRSPDEARLKLINSPRGFLWWAIQNVHLGPSHAIVTSIAAKYPEMRIILLQHSYKIEMVKELFEYGISGFLSDMCSVEEIIEAIGVTTSGHKYVDHKVAISLSTAYLELPDKSDRASFSITDREREVLRLIVDEYTTQEIAAKLFISKCTVETHRLHLIRKLGVKNTAGLVREAVTQALYVRAS